MNKLKLVINNLEINNHRSTKVLIKSRLTTIIQNFLEYNDIAIYNGKTINVIVKKIMFHYNKALLNNKTIKESQDNTTVQIDKDCKCIFCKTYPIEEEKKKCSCIDCKSMLKTISKTKDCNCFGCQYYKTLRKNKPINHDNKNT